jgi:hypothetical protein
MQVNRRDRVMWRVYCSPVSMLKRVIVCRIIWFFGWLSYSQTKIGLVSTRLTGGRPLGRFGL